MPTIFWSVCEPLQRLSQYEENMRVNQVLQSAVKLSLTQGEANPLTFRVCPSILNVIFQWAALREVPHLMNETTAHPEVKAQRSPPLITSAVECIFRSRLCKFTKTSETVCLIEIKISAKVLKNRTTGKKIN